MVGWAHRLWEQYRPDRQTQKRSRGVLIREKEPRVPSATDTDLTSLQQTVSMLHIYTQSFRAVLKETSKETVIKTEEINKGSSRYFPALPVV